MTQPATLLLAVDAVGLRHFRCTRVFQRIAGNLREGSVRLP
jgi:hypothetical protein